MKTGSKYYNNERPHSGRYCYGKTPMQTFLDSKKLAIEKNNEILFPLVPFQPLPPYIAI